MIYARWRRTGASLAILVLCGFLIVFVHQASNALVVTREGCSRPAVWPKELDQVGKSCRTIEFMAGSQENIYEIVFEDRDKFERLWPLLLTVKTPAAPLRLLNVKSPPTTSLFTHGKPAVRVFGPPVDATSVARSEAGNEHRDIGVLLAEGKALHPPGHRGLRGSWVPTVSFPNTSTQSRRMDA